jgi:citrate lyase beta subunit
MHAYRSHTCGALRTADAGKDVRLAGWVHRKRDLGGVLFIDLRDNYGITQLVANPGSEAFPLFERLRAESVVRVDGKVIERAKETVNKDLATGEIEALAAHPRIESLSFGLMDFVSAHRGAVPRWAMSVEGQFDHPLVVRAKLEIAAACHAYGKTPAHGVVTEFKDTRALAEAVGKARDLLGFTRMWSIHPDQVRTIVEAFTPAAAEVDEATEILLAAQAAEWAPIRHRDTLHDRASYRYYWTVLQRAKQSGQRLPETAGALM